MASLRSDSWLSRFTAEKLAFMDGPQSVTTYLGMSQPLLIQRYAMSMFNDGGAMLLLYFVPEEITEEHWDAQNVVVMYFHGIQHFDAIPEIHMPERTLEQNFVVLSRAEDGWVVTLAGEIDMKEMLEVARNLEIRETGKLLTQEDFENKYTFFDGGIG